LGDQTIWGKHTLYDRSLKSPLIVKVPSQKSITRLSTAIVETVDIYPTITDLAGLPRPAKLSGENLLTKERRRPVPGRSQGVVRTGQHADA